MIQRCFNKNIPGYSAYGAIGITVCEFLRATPRNLLDLIGHRPDDKPSLDRINNRGSYTCGQCAECVTKDWTMNVRWANRTEQNRNQNDLHYFTFNGVTKCLSEWAEHFGISDRSVRARIRYGWPVEKLFTPARQPVTVEVNGVARSVGELAKEIGIDQSTLRGRIRIGLSGEKLLQPKVKIVKITENGVFTETLSR